MIEPLTAADIILLREALVALGRADAHAITLAARESQSRAQTGFLVRLGDRAQHIRILDAQLRDRHAALTGMPAIQHGNTDIADCSSPAWPMTRADEAREANHRG